MQNNSSWSNIWINGFEVSANISMYTWSDSPMKQALLLLDTLILCHDQDQDGCHEDQQGFSLSGSNLPPYANMQHMGHPWMAVFQTDDQVRIAYTHVIMFVFQLIPNDLFAQWYQWYMMSDIRWKSVSCHCKQIWDPNRKRVLAPIHHLHCHGNECSNPSHPRSR